MTLLTTFLCLFLSFRFSLSTAPLESAQNSLDFGNEDWDWWITQLAYDFRGDELADVFSGFFDEDETLIEAMPPISSEKSSTPALEQEAQTASTTKTRQKRKRALVGPEEGTPTSFSASLLAPHVDATSDEAKAKVLAHKMLLSRFWESTGLHKNFIPWSAVEITGWPGEISCYQPHNWRRPELDAFFAAYDKISFKLKEAQKRQNRTGENLEIYNEIKRVLIERNLMPEDSHKIRWKELSELAPGLRLSSREYKRWSESDREAIREHIIEPYLRSKSSQK